MPLLFLVVTLFTKSLWALGVGDQVLVMPVRELYEIVSIEAKPTTYVLREVLTNEDIKSGLRPNVITAKRSEFKVKIAEFNGLKVGESILYYYKDQWQSRDKCLEANYGRGCVSPIVAIFEEGHTLFNLYKPYEPFEYMGYLSLDAVITYLKPDSPNFRRERAELNGVKKGERRCLKEDLLDEENEVVFKRGDTAKVDYIFEDGIAAITRYTVILGEKRALAKVEVLVPCPQ